MRILRDPPLPELSPCANRIGNANRERPKEAPIQREVTVNIGDKPFST